MPKGPKVHDATLTIKLPAELLSAIEADCRARGEVFASSDRPRVSAWVRDAAEKKLKVSRRKR